MGKRGKCVVCGTKFELKKKGFKRFSLKAQLGPNYEVDVLTALSKIRPDIAASKYPDDGHVCDSCFRLLRSTLRQREQIVKTEIEWENRFVNGPYGKQIQKTKKIQRSKKSAAGSRGTRKRKLGEVQNILNDKDRKSKRLKLEPTISILCKNGGHKNYMKLVIAYLLQYRYHRAFTTLVAGSKRAKEAFLGVLENQVRKEVFYYCKSAETCSEEASVESFSWNQECKKIESKMPTFYSACYAAMDTRKGTDLVNTANVKKALVRPRLGLMMTLPLYTRRGRKFGFVPHTLSLLLHHYGNSDKVMKILHHLGVCRPSTPALMTKVDELQKDEAEKLLFWATKNLGENLQQSTIMGRPTTKMPSRKGKLPKASLPPADGNASDESDDDQSSDDENAPVDNDDDEGEESDDSSLMNLLSSDEEDEEETDDDEDDDEEAEWMEVGEDEMVVEGCVEDIAGQEVELVLMESYKALKGGT